MTRIGFIGVGTMGLPMAINLVKKGFAVTAFDLNPEAVKAAAAAGMTAAASAAEAVAGADLVITMLPSSSHVDAAYSGDGGVLAAGRKGTLCVDMSTIDPAVSRRVAAAAAERGLRFIDAPVSGGVTGATDGTLAIMVGGAAADVTAARPALEAMGTNVIHVGAVGSGRGRQALQQPHRGRLRGGGQRGVPDRRGFRRRPQGGHGGHLEVLRKHMGDGTGASGAGPRRPRGLHQ